MRHVTLFSIAGLLCLTLLGCSKSPSRQVAPDFTLRRVEDENVQITLSEVAKENSVLLVFWATWCPSCVDEIPVLNQWHKQYRDQDFRILAVNVQEPREEILAFKSLHPFDYDSVVDEDGDVVARYGLVGLPVSLFLAKGGEIIYYGFGLPTDVDQLLAWT